LAVIARRRPAEIWRVQPGVLGRIVVIPRLIPGVSRPEVSRVKPQAGPLERAAQPHVELADEFELARTRRAAGDEILRPVVALEIPVAVGGNRQQLERIAPFSRHEIHLHSAVWAFGAEAGCLESHLLDSCGIDQKPAASTLILE